MLAGLWGQVATAIVPGGDEMDLAQVKPRADCAGKGDEITVCARDPNRYRMQAPAPAYADPQRLETHVAGGTLSVEAEQRSLPGASAPAAMVRFRIPLGKPRQ